MAGQAVYLEIDASDVMAKTEKLREKLTDKEVGLAMRRVFHRVPGHVRKVLREDLPRQYEVKAGEISAAVGHGKTITSGTGVGCTIPVTGSKRGIGSKISASGGAHGWASLHRKYRVKAKILKGQQSVLPANASSYGGQPPFRNLGSSLMPHTFTRAGKGRLPIMKMVGIAVPQMPMNRSEGDVQADIKSYLEKRMEHEFAYLLGGK